MKYDEHTVMLIKYWLHQNISVLY